MKKKLTYLLLMMFFCAFAQAQDVNVGDEFTEEYAGYGLEYKITSTTDPKTCTLIGFGTNPTGYINLVIPEAATDNNGTEDTSDDITYNVTAIGEYAFQVENPMSDPKIFIKSVIIPATITSIGEYAFNNCAFTKMICFGTPNIAPNSLPFTAYAGLNPQFTKLHLFVPNADVTAYTTWMNNYNATNGEETDLDINIYQLIDDYKVEYKDNNSNVKYSLIFNYADESYESLKVRLGDKKPTAENKCSLTIPETVNVGVVYNVTEIEANAFSDASCANFTSVLCPAVNPPATGDGCFAKINSVPLYVGVTFTGSIGNWDTNIHNDYSDNNNTIWETTFSKIKPITYRKDYNEDYSLDYTITDTETRECAVTSSIINNTTTHITIDNTITIAEGTKTETTYKVTAIGDNAFNNGVNQSVVGVTIPDNIRSIGNDAFDGLNNFTQMICLGADPPAITTQSLPGGAYNGKLNLFVPNAAALTAYTQWMNNYNANNNEEETDLDINIYQFIYDYKVDYKDNNSNVKYSLIFNYADNTYQSLKVKLHPENVPDNPCSLIIPATVNIDGVVYNVTEIEEGAFSHESCANFKSVLCTAVTPPTLPTTGTDCFLGIADKTPLYVGGESYDENGNLVTTNYSSIETWNTKFTIKPASKKESYNSDNSEYSLVYTISDLDNKHCAISSVEIESANNLTLHIVASVNINEVNYAVTAIGDNAFKDNSGNYTFSNFTFDYNTSLSYIGSEAIAFANGINLTLPESVTKLADNAFKNANFNSITVYSENITLGENILNDGDVIYIPKMYKDNYDSWTVGTKNLNKIYMPCLVNEGTNEAVGIWDKEGNITSADKIVVKGQCILPALPAGTTTCDTYYLLKDASLKLDVDLVDNNNNNNAQLVLNSNGNRPLTVTKTISKFEDPEVSDGWYTISSPLKDDITLSSDVSNITSGTYDLYRYDEPSYTWQNSKTGENSPGFQVIEPGRGYLYANAANTTLSFTGEVNTDNVEYTLTANGTTLSGIHLIGNPFTHNITAANFTLENATLASGYYVLSNNGGWDTQTYLESTGEIKPGQGALIKASVTNSENEATLTIKNTASSKGQQPRANSQQPMLSLNVSNSNYSDRAFVIFGEGVGLDKINHENKDIPLLYIPMSDADYAIAMMDESVNEIPVSFETNKMGEFTITLKHENCEFEELYLLDKETGSKVNILEEEYTFMATSGDNPDRFVLVKDNGQQTTDNSHFAYINNGDVVIYGAEGNAHIDIYDVMGRRVYNTTGRDDVHIVSTDGYSAGVYVIRLMDENGLRTQKVIID